MEQFFKEIGNQQLLISLKIVKCFPEDMFKKKIRIFWTHTIKFTGKRDIMRFTLNQH